VLGLLALTAARCGDDCGGLMLCAANLRPPCPSPQSLDGVMGRLLEVREILVQKNKGVNYINLDEVRECILQKVP
jgi:hypothetical protein